ncbi:MAG: hypothetical protein K0R34_4227, partial [Herbinix sp.]|nr:hypothetical protein [Herbinix sp.]
MEKELEMNNGDSDSQTMGSLEKETDKKIEQEATSNIQENIELQENKELQENIELQENNEILKNNELNDNISMDGSEEPCKEVELKKDTKKTTRLGHSEVVSRIGNKLKKAGNFIIGRGRIRSEQILGGVLYSFLYFAGLIMYLEVIFHFLIYRSLDSKIIYPIIFAIPFGALLAFITGLFQAKVNKLILWLVSTGLCTVYLVQLVYYNVFKVFFSFQIMGMADDAISEFGSDIFTAIKGNIGGLVILLLPLVLLGFLISNRIAYRHRRIREQGLLLGGAALFHLLALASLLLFGKLDYSPYDLYFNSKVPDLLGQQLGVTTMTRIDIFKLLSPEDELVLADTLSANVTTPIPTGLPTPIITPVVRPTEPAKPDATPTPTPLPTPTPIDTSPNVMEIDFKGLAEKEKNKTIKTLHNYFETVTPTNKNEYTGKFKGYNLIMITAEGFSPYAIHKEKTPTLYRLVQEGFVFNNFYTALWQTSTSDGEYVAMTGLIPQGTRSMFNGRNNSWPFSLGHQFNQLGVASKAYHNHTYTYYQRNETHTNMGYLWKAKGNGLDLPTDSWPESDLEMIDATVDEYVKEEQFHVYYLTVSGHMNYTFTGNSMASKNKKLVQDLPYTEDAKAYIACQIELDRALEALLAKLETAGVADRTVIALSADHYPYGWEKYK